jgi:hypothetical protein
MKPYLLPLLMGCAMLAACGPQVVATAPPVAPASATPAATETAGQPAATAIPTETLVPTAVPSPTPDLAASVAELPDPAGYEWQEVVTGLAQPVDIESAADGSGRLFVIERAGRIVILDEGGSLLRAPFLDIQSNLKLCIGARDCSGWRSIACTGGLFLRQLLTLPAYSYRAIKFPETPTLPTLARSSCSNRNSPSQINGTVTFAQTAISTLGWG